MAKVLLQFKELVLHSSAVGSSLSQHPAYAAPAIYEILSAESNFKSIIDSQLLADDVEVHFRVVTSSTDSDLECHLDLRSLVSNRVQLPPGSWPTTPTEKAPRPSSTVYTDKQSHTTAVSCRFVVSHRC